MSATHSVDRSLDAKTAFGFGLALLAVGNAHRASNDRALKQIGSSRSVAWPLILIGRHEGRLHQNTLASLLGCDSAALGRVIDKLLAAGLVVRRADPRDRRVWVLALTERGRAHCDELEAHLCSVYQEMLRPLGRGEIEAASQVLSVLARSLENPGASAQAG